MTAARRLALVSVDDYLVGESASSVKHEYRDGFVYAMAGARNRHNAIASNVLIAIGSRLRGKPCRAFNSDTKIRVRQANRVRLYYPDGQVSCRPNPEEDSFQDEPAVLVEVLSESTRRIDEGEKCEAYLSIPSLAVYLLVEQDVPAVAVYRRTEDGFVREVYEGLEAVIPLGEVGAELPLTEVYEGVVFTSDSATEAEES